MAAKSSKAKTENQETGVDKVSTPAETSEPVETPEEPTENADASEPVETPEEPTENADASEPVETPEEPTEGPDTEGDSDVSVSEEPKILIATRPILYLAKQYKAGDKLPVNNQEMVDAWIDAGSAAWQKPDVKQFP